MIFSLDSLIGNCLPHTAWQREVLWAPPSPWTERLRIWIHWLVAWCLWWPLQLLIASTFPVCECSKCRRLSKGSF